MEYVIIAYDGTDEGVLERRLSVREEHLALGAELKAAGKMLYGGAMLNESDKMIGSVIICNFESKAELDDYMKREPYISHKVWQKVEVQKFRVPPMYRAASEAASIR